MDPEARIRAGDVMSTPIETVPQTATVREAAERMTDLGVNALVVRGDATGIITSSDVVAAVGDGRDPRSTAVEAVMTAPIETVDPGRELQSVAELMTEFQVKHLPVEDDGIVGMVSSTEAAAYLPRYEPPV